MRGLSIDNDVIDTHLIGDNTKIGRLCLSSLFHLVIFRDGLDVNKELRQGQVGELLDCQDKNPVMDETRRKREGSWRPVIKCLYFKRHGAQGN